MRWKLVRNEGEAHAAEAGWIGAHLDGDGPKTPGTALARFAVRSFGPAILHAGSGGNMLAIGAAAVVFITLGVGWAGFPVIALVLCGIGWIVRRAAALLMAVEQESMARAASRWPREPLFDWVLDLIMIAILIWNTAPFPDSSWWHRGFAPLILMCLVRLYPQLTDRAWAAWLADRSLLALLLAIAAGAGVLTLAIPALAVLLALLAILLPARLMRITRV